MRLLPALLAAALLSASPALADTRQEEQTQVAPGARARAASGAERDRYAEREREARELEDFEGGRGGTIATSTVIIVLLVVILVIIVL